MTNEELLKVIEAAKASGATSLNLSECRLKDVPPEICQLTNLTKLLLYHNNLIKLPPEISHLTNLAELDLSWNQLRKLPSEICCLSNLTRLDLSENHLTHLPPEICCLSKLKELHLGGNPLISPPPEITEKGIDAIRQYFSALQQEELPLNEVKLLIVGEGSAGKTSLVKKLIRQEFDRNENTTHGINILGCKMMFRQQKIRINIWDFGGQEIQHATHQFFLSKRSLYVLVLDGRKDERPEYWLRHIEAFGGGLTGSGRAQQAGQQPVI